MMTPDQILRQADQHIAARKTSEQPAVSSAQPQEPPRYLREAEAGFEPQRTWGEAAKDVGVGIASGGAGLVKTAGDLYGLASGDMDNAASSWGRGAQKYLADAKSDALKEKIAQRSADIDAQDSTLGKAWAAIKGTLTDPALAVDTVAENAATMLPGLGVGRLAGGITAARGLKAAQAAGTVSQQALKQIGQRAGKVGTGAAVGAGAVQQGADVSGDIYQDLLDKADAQWQASPEFVALVQKNGGDAQAAKRELALQTARAAMLPATAISAAANALPGAAMLERALAGAALKEGGKTGALAAMKSLAKGMFGEGAQEAVEEGGGRLAANVAAQNFAMPGHDTWDGVGENAGMGFAGGLLLGGVGGAREGIHSLRGSSDGTADSDMARNAALTAAADAQAKAAAASPEWTTDLGATDPNASQQTGPASAANAPQVEGVDFGTSPGAAPEYSNSMDYQREFDTGGLTLVGDGVPQLPSEAMGLRSGPDAGALESAAAMAVDTGATARVQEAIARTEPADAAHKADPAATKQERPAKRKQTADPNTGEISDVPGSLAEWTDVDLSTAFRNAQSKDVRRQLAQELSRRRTARENADFQVALQADQPQNQPGAPGANAKGANVATLAQLNRKQLPNMSDGELHQLASLLPTGHKRQAKIAKEIQARAQKAQSAINQGVKTDGTQTTQTQQAGAEPAQTGAAQGSQPAAAKGLTDGSATAENPGAQAISQRGVEAGRANGSLKSQNDAADALRQQLREVEQKIILAAPAAMGQGGGDIEAAMKSRKVPLPLKAQRKRLLEQIKATQASEQVESNPNQETTQQQAASAEQPKPVTVTRSPGVTTMVIDPGAGVLQARAEARPQASAGVASPVQAVTAAANEAATSQANDLPQPTEAQKEAGNYKKGHTRVNGLDISIENPAGSRRRPEWPLLQNHYGYIKGSVGADKDHVDVFMTDRAHEAELPVFVVDQVNQDGSFDEHKVVLGAADEAEARDTYLGNYAKGWTGLGGITQMTQDEFKAWVRDPAKTKKPAGALARTTVQPAATEADPFANNRLFTADKVAAARERLKKKLGTLNSGIDPELLVDGMTIAGAYIESGVRNFTQYAKAMIEDMGDGVKPYLLSFWEGARNYPGLNTDGMTDPAESARQHQALLTPEVKAAAPDVGQEVKTPAKRTKKTGAKGDMTLTQDWGVEHINGYSDGTRGEVGNATKDAFLKEAREYLTAVAAEFEGAGFEPHTDHKGKAGKPVSVNESGMAGSGDVTLTMRHPGAGTNVYVHIGDSALRGMFPSTASGIAVMARTSQKAGDTYASSGTNRWMPVDMSAIDLAALLLADARGNMRAQARATETKDVNNGNPEQAGRAADQGRASEVSGRGRRDNDSAAPADSGDLESRQPGDVPAPAHAGRAGSDGVRVPAADVGRAGPADQGGNAGDGRTRAGRAAAPDAGTREKPSVKAPEEVSPANPGPGNFHIENPLEIVGGTPVVRFDKNQAAIELLNELRESERPATVEEQRTLAGYTGWGSFGQELFQGTWAKPMPKAGWEKRDQWLRDHLGQDEWESAQRSITNAHYTDPPTVMAMWDMAKRMGFTGGRVLEPSMGIGNFFGMMPADIKGRSQLAGIELDSLTGDMAKRLYPDANIKVMGYQQSRTPDDFYDLVIGNWPFENTVIADRRYNALGPFLHDYFFLKALDQVRPGGLVIGITSNGTMDKKATRIRAALARKAELVTAIRLPSGAFQEYAGTKVVTDIVILKKREKALSLTPNDPWVNSVAYKTPAGPEVFINEFYANNPGNVIGTTDYGHGTTRMQPGMIVHRPENMAERLREAASLVPEGIFTKAAPTEHISYVTNHIADREGALSEQDGKLYVVRGEHLAPAQEVRKYALKSVAATARREQELRALIDMRRKYAQLIEAERGGSADAARKSLRDAFDAFKAEHGALSDSFGLDYLRKIDDPFYPALAALEVGGKPSDILVKSTMRGARGIENPTPQDAYVLARNKSVQPTLAEIAQLAGQPEAQVRVALVQSGAVFEVPNGDIAPSDIYLSGNVRQKLREAQAALDDGNKAMQRNVDALKAVVPADVPYFNIESQLGATWVPAKVYAGYVAHMLNRPNADGIEAAFLNGRWKIRLPDGINHAPEAKTGFGTAEYPFSKLVNAAFSNQTVKIRRKDSDGIEYVDTEATDEANARIADIRTKFAEWLWSDPERRTALELEYNESRNAYATPKYDGSFLNFDGMALSLGRGPFNLRQHQVNAIWRALVNRRSLNAHEVGTGKTFTMGGIAVESRRYGIAQKPLLLAHNANSATVAAEIQMMYPAAKVLYIDNLDKDSIAVRMRQIANDDWDTIVMPHSLIDRLSFREETLMEMAREDIRSLEEEAYAAAEEDGVSLTAEIMDDEEKLKKVRSVTAKELVKARNRIIETIKKQAQQSSREGAIPFEDLGIDMVLVDEVHEFKKPPISTRMSMKGMNTQTSNRSIALQFITRYIRANNFGGNVHTFTGTPITNTLTEIFHQMRYVMEDEMKVAGVETWDGWFGSFAKEVQDVELSAAGEYEAINRLAGFINVPELRRMIGQYMDVVFAEDMPEMQPRKVNGKVLTSPDLTEAERAQLLNGRTENAADRPYKKVINVTSDLTDEQSRIFAQLQGYARAWRGMRGKERIEAMRNGSPESPIITEGLANKASFDVRLMQDEAYAGQEGNVPDAPGSKASKVVANVLDIYKSDDRTTQVIFAEQGFSTSKDKSMGRDPSGKKITRRAKTFSTMRDIVERLVQGGIPREQIAIVDGNVSKEKRKEIAEAMNALRIRVVIGSTDTLGVGVNMQRNLRAMHHMDAPYMPGELEQRNGRGLRQGNQWNTVLEYRYMTDRLDGRRWQILAIKQRFITAFMKSNSENRVIEGDAASDEESDILQSFSEAAGDPRILIRAKQRKNVEALQRAERLHGNGVADARRTLRSTREAIEWNRGILKKMTADNLPTRLRTMMAEQSDNFQMEVQGQQYDTRKDAEEALDRFLKSDMRMEQSGVKAGTYRNQAVTARWPAFSSQPELVMEVGGQEFSSSSLRGLEQQVRNYPQRIEKVQANIDQREASIERLEQVSKAPFARAADLEAAQKRLVALEKDIEVNPVPPPAWLRAGAPVDSSAYRSGKEFQVTGHRWTQDGWFVLGQDAKGEMSIPYTEVTDAQGMPLYEEREFQAPEVIEKGVEKGPEREQQNGDVANFASRAASVQRPGTAQDKAVMQALADGKSARDILRQIASTSKTPFNRQVARLLLKAGITSKVELRHLGQHRGNPLHGQYSKAQDAITLAASAEHAAERIFLHEAMHAATARALAKRGLHALQMRKLFEHVKSQGGAAGSYGMTNLDEFVAEVFTNPDFQRRLKTMSAPSGSPLKTAWDALVRIMRSILGLGQDSHSALSRALELGVGVVREDMGLRKVQAPGAVRAADAHKAGVEYTESFKQWYGDWQNVANERSHERVSARVRPDARGIDALPDVRRAQGMDQGAGVRAAGAFDVGPGATFPGASGPTGADGAPLRLYHGTRDDIAAFDLNHPNRKDYGWLGQGVYLTNSLDAAEIYAQNKRGYGGQVLMPLYAAVRNPYVATEAEKTRIKLAGPAASRAFTEHVKAKGHDGVVLDLGDGAIELVAFEPTQVKSAIGNNGNFDPNDPDIRHFGMDDIQHIKTSALDQIHQSLSYPGKVSLWDKTVGTMRHLAERNPAFKPVFEGAQRFIDDVALLANEAADAAPRLLPRVDSLGDIVGKSRKKPITAADNKAIAKPLFEGTLMWARDLHGKALPLAQLQERYRNLSAEQKAEVLLAAGRIKPQVLAMWRGLPVAQFETLVNGRFEGQVLKPGVVFTAQELKALFGLTDGQVALYQEARAVIDRSIDFTARADMLRALGEDYSSLREVVLGQETLQDAFALMTDALQADARDNPQQAERLLATNNLLVKRYETAQELVQFGYAPLSRFGRYTVDVVDAAGERQYFGMFESKREANQMEMKMRDVFKGATVTQGTMSEQAHKLFAGITPESLEMFGNMLGLDSKGDEAKDKAFQEYLKLAKNNHSALKRLIHRKGIEGYSEDVGRVLASFVYSNARLGAGGLNAGTLESAINAIPKEQGELKDVALALRSYIQDPQEEGQAVRGMLFAQYLGGSVASAFVNMTQPFAVTLPWLSQYGGMRVASGYLARALKDMGTRGFAYEPDLAKALQQAEDDGTVSPQEIHQLMAQARGTGSLRVGDGTRLGDTRATLGNAWEKTKVAWGQPFAIAEQFNRRSTFIAAYRLARERKMADPAEFARKAVLETQFLYSKANKMRWARGAVGGALMTFKTYSVSYLELLHRMWTQGGPEGKRAVGWAMAMLLLMGGAGGLPFMEDLEDLIDAIAQRMGVNVSTKRLRQEFLAGIVGKELADFMEQGVSGLPGAPVDVSGRLGLGNLIPGTGLLMQKQNRERDLLEVAGPAGDLVARGFAGMGKLLTGDLKGAALEVSPTAVRNVAKGVDMATSGMYKDTKGYKVIDTTLDEAMAKALGFQPKSVAEVQEANSFMQRSKSFYQQTSADIKAQWADALFRKDDAALERVRARLAAWNRDNPEQPIIVRMPDVWRRVREMGKDKAQRIADTAPKALRQQMREMVAAGGV